MSVVNLESLLTCVVTAGASYALIADERMLLDVLSVAAVYGFLSFLIFLLLHMAYPPLAGRLGAILVSMGYVVVMYRSNLTEMITMKREADPEDE